MIRLKGEIEALNRLTLDTYPLSGLKILDLSIIVSGGTASSLLGDFGPVVVKVVRPGSEAPPAR